MVVVDASVWVSRFVPSDTHHKASTAWLGKQVLHGQVIVDPAIVLPEVAGAISRQTGNRELARQTVEGMLKLSVLRLVPLDELFAEASARLAADLKLRGVDTAYVTVAHQLGITLVTLDNDQRKKASHVIAVEIPHL